MTLEEFIAACEGAISSAYWQFSWEGDAQEAVTIRATVKGKKWSTTFDSVRRKPRVVVRKGLTMLASIVEPGTVHATTREVGVLARRLEE